MDDEHHFTHEPEEDDGGTWSTPEEERTFRGVRDLLMLLRDRGSGIYIRPVEEGSPAGGLGSDETYGFDGWVVGVSLLLDPPQAETRTTSASASTRRERRIARP